MRNMRFIKHAVDANNNAYMDVTISEGRYYIHLAVGELHDIERCETEADLYKQYTKWEEQFGITEDDGTFNLYEFEQAMIKGERDAKIDEEVERMMRDYNGSLVEVIEREGIERIEIWQFGKNDFSVDYMENKCSVRGTLLEVMADLQNTYGIFD